jgi:peptide/nickel transport system permease protein
MLAFIVQRLLQAILVMLVVALIAFSLFQFVGDPINNMVGQETTTAQREALRERLGLNDPIPVQFVKWRMPRRASSASPIAWANRSPS